MFTCVCDSSGASREAPHVLSEPGVEFGLRQLSGFVCINRLGSPALSSPGLDLALHLPSGLSSQS